MSRGKKPSVFVSSTCYDLAPVRDGLKDFIENQLGYDAVLSEQDTFPIDPNQDTIENCLRAVNERADIFVLVIGNRYGFETDRGKSITNLEYVYAKAKGIPIYVFILKSVLTAMNIWKDNKDADFKSVVDSNKIFEFIQGIRETNRGWTYEFETSHNILSILRHQFAYLLNDSLLSHSKLYESDLSSRAKQLDAKSLRIVIEKPQLWEYSLFGSILEYQISELKHLKDDYRYRLYFGNCMSLNDNSELLTWVGSKFKQLGSLTGHLATLFNDALPIAVGEPGVAGDVEQIIYVADSVGRAYKAFIDWALEFDSILVDDSMDALISYARGLADDVIEEIEKYCIRYNNTIVETISLLPDYHVRYQETNEELFIDLSWKLPIPDSEKIAKKMRLLSGFSMSETD